MQTQFEARNLDSTFFDFTTPSNNPEDQKTNHCIPLLY